MDEKDVRLIVTLRSDPFASLATLGRRIGVSGTTAKARLDRMHASGAFTGIAILPGPRLLGRHGRGFAFGPFEQDCPEPAWAVGFENVVWASRMHPGVLVIETANESPSAGPPKALVEAVGREPVLTSSRSPPKKTLSAPVGQGPEAVSPLDWRIVDALLVDPRAPVATLARATGLGARTVRARRSALLERGHVQPHLLLDVSREPGVVVFTVFTRFHSVDARARLRPGDHAMTLISTNDEPPTALLLGHVATYAQAHDVGARIRALPGVEAAHVVIPQGSAVAVPRLRAWVAEALARWDAARRRSPPSS